MSIRQPIANAGHGQDECGAARIELDLFPQPAHTDIDYRFAFHFGIIPPDGIQNLSSAKRLPAVLCKVDQ